MIVHTHPVYGIFDSSPERLTNMNVFNSSEAELVGSLRERPADFSIRTPRNWQATARDIAILITKIVIFPLGIYELARYVIQRLIMIPLYPAQSRIVRFVASTFLGIRWSMRALDAARLATCQEFNRRGFLVRHVCLEKDGVRYSGLLIGHRDTINNGKWVLQATGNGEHVEHSALDIAGIYRDSSFNTLLINGPGVGRSEGHATPASMGEVQRLGISFLETAIRAKKIVIAGRSLGGAAVGQAVLRHDFKPDIQYLVVRQMTFDRVSNIAALMIGAFARRLVIWAGCEMDSVAVSTELQRKGIREIIVQAGIKLFSDPADSFMNDGVIPERACLGRAVVEAGVAEGKTFHRLLYAQHMTNDAMAVLRDELLIF